jgi:hypothetical protein
MIERMGVGTNEEKIKYRKMAPKQVKSISP